VSDSNGVSPSIFHLTGVPVLLDAVVTFFISIVLLTQNGSFWILPVLHLVSDKYHQL
jgi:hypothetical protein